MEINLTGKAGPRWKFAWKEFAIYGLIWLAVFIIGNGCYRAYKQIQFQREMMNRCINLIQGGGDSDLPFGEGSRNRTATLETWIKNNLPKNVQNERDPVADVFDNVAEMVESEELKGVTDAFPEAVSQLQACATYRRWLPFLTGLTRQVKRESLDDPDVLAETLHRVADAIRPAKRARAVNALSAADAEPESANEPENKAKNEADAQTESASETATATVTKPNAAPAVNSVITPSPAPSVPSVSRPATTPSVCPNGTCPTTGPVYYYGGLQ